MYKNMYKRLMRYIYRNAFISTFVNVFECYKRWFCNFIYSMLYKTISIPPSAYLVYRESDNRN